MYVKQLYDNGQLIDPQAAFDKYNLQPLSYNALVSAIPKRYKNVYRKKEMVDEDEPHQYDMVCKWSKPSALYYKKEQDDPNGQFATYTRWQVNMHTELSYKEFLKLFKNIYVITNHSKLRSFQYRMLNLAIVTNVDLHRWKIKSSPLCTFCKNENETMYHLFFFAPKLENFTQK